MPLSEVENLLIVLNQSAERSIFLTIGIIILPSKWLQAHG